FVVAIGDPYGLGQSASSGIVSALERSSLRAAGYQNFIQTDAAINPGNSGGALVDAQGNLVGINTAIYSESGGSMGIGFATPIDIARKVMDEIVKTGGVKRGWLGVEPQDMTAELARAFQLERDARGVIIAGVLRGKWQDTAISTFALLGFSMPVFWLALLLMLFFSLHLGWLPVSGRFDLLYQVKPITGFALIDAWLSDSPYRAEMIGSALRHMILPIAA
ncbi:trypsin-like peptidase domain-containing protein, partial [Piscirickettsia salmonis]|uniref:trypsin-like peptidase domain-containing protein n=1 Tax=Piscirickettsia salmonis TaxID=1238 RepID=UPI001C54CAE2